ncbi:mobilization protein NikA [Staphylococcus hominis]
MRPLFWSYIFMILNCEWLAISHSFFRRKNPKGLGEYPQQAGDDTTYVASDETVGRNRKPNRKEPKQISFRVSESEYLKLQQSAETLNMSVPSFVKKKAQGARLVAPKLDQATRQSVAKDLSMLGANANQIAKYCNQHQHEAPNYKALERNINELRERLDEIWKKLN